jgi:hypothetical protein
VDREHRIENKLGWWPEEALSGAEVHEAIMLGRRGPVDVLLTHDCPPSHPFDKLIPSFQSKDVHSAAHRQNMGRIGRALRPRFWYHGHYHWPADYQFEHQQGVCRVRSLDRDGNPIRTSTVVLDTDSKVAGSPLF